MAPLLINGLCGKLSLFKHNSLKFLPLGSRPTKLCMYSLPFRSEAIKYEIGLEHDWTQNSWL